MLKLVLTTHISPSPAWQRRGNRENFLEFRIHFRAQHKHTVETLERRVAMLHSVLRSTRIWVAVHLEPATVPYYYCTTGTNLAQDG